MYVCMYVELIKFSILGRSNCSMSHEGTGGLRSNCPAHPGKPTVHLPKTLQIAAWPQSPVLGFLAGILPPGPLGFLSIP